MSIREGVGYNEVYPLGHEPMEDLIWSLERKPFAHSLVEEEKEEGEEDEDENDEENDGEEGEDHEEGDGIVDKVEGDGYRPFILPLIWMVNDFYPTMSSKVFNTLRAHYQIPTTFLCICQGNLRSAIWARQRMSVCKTHCSQLG